MHDFAVVLQIWVQPSLSVGKASNVCAVDFSLTFIHFYVKLTLLPSSQLIAICTSYTGEKMQMAPRIFKRWECFKKKKKNSVENVTACFVSATFKEDEVRR